MIIKDNVLIINMKFYENYITTQVAMISVNEKNQITFPLKLGSQF